MAQLTSILQSSFSRRLLPIYVLWGALHHENIICRMIVWEWHTVYAQLSRSFLATPAAIWWSGAVFPTIGSVIWAETYVSVPQEIIGISGASSDPCIIPPLLRSMIVKRIGFNNSKIGSPYP
jgi:hypothetical protein